MECYWIIKLLLLRWCLLVEWCSRKAEDHLGDNCCHYPAVNCSRWCRVVEWCSWNTKNTWSTNFNAYILELTFLMNSCFIMLNCWSYGPSIEQFNRDAHSGCKFGVQVIVILLSACEQLLHTRILSVAQFIINSVV